MFPPSYVKGPEGPDSHAVLLDLCAFQAGSTRWKFAIERPLSAFYPSLLTYNVKPITSTEYRVITGGEGVDEENRLQVALPHSASFRVGRQVCARFP